MSEAIVRSFPGYKYDAGKSTYRWFETGEGGYVYAEPGLYHNVAVLDVASMHPNSIIALDSFGKYTKNFKDILDARVAIKHGDYESARKMLDGKLSPYLEDEKDAKDLSFALKIAINSVYGLTKARHPNKFRDNRNKDNIVAKRGALFMVDLQLAVAEKGYSPIHIKTDSIKIPDADQEIIDFVSEFGEKYGYTFEHENTYDSFCLVNNAVYIAREGDKWEAVGAQFQHPYVYKKLFTKEEIIFDDLIESKNVKKGAMYLNATPDIDPTDDQASLRFMGKTGTFVPVLEGTPGSGKLLRKSDDKFYAVTGTKGHIWMDASEASELGEGVVDYSYFNKLSVKAYDDIEEFGSYSSLFPQDNVKEVHF